MSLIHMVTRKAGLDAKTRTVSFVMSNATADRYGDTVQADGWKLANYKANPVLLWCHNSSAPPVGKCLDIRVRDGALLGDYQFTTAEEYEFGDTIYKLFVGEYLNAGSVGFIPIDYEGIRDRNGDWIGVNFKTQELTEFSACPVPAHPQALAVARSLGLATETLGRLTAETPEYETERRAILAALPPVHKSLPLARAKAAMNSNRGKLLAI